MPVALRPWLSKLAPLTPRWVKRAGYELVDWSQRTFSRIAIQERPTFVLGNHKAGTTAIAALLAKLSGLSVSLELKRQIHRPQFEQVLSGKLPLAEFISRNRVDFSRQIIKENQLLFLYDGLAERFPAGQFVLVVRDPRDNLRSILNRLRLPGDGDWQFDEISVDPGWRNVLDNRLLGIQHEHYIDQLAERWNKAADVYLTHSGRVNLFRYEDFGANKIGTLTALAETLGIPHEHNIQPALDIQYQPRGDRGVTWPEFFGKANLRRIETICRERMERLGYTMAASGGPKA